jgi:chloramphenicol-sensitive protein RarD
MKTVLSPEKRERLVGLAFTATAFLFWGLYPPYWKLLEEVPQFQVFAHRVVWSCLFTALVVTVQRRWPEVRAALRSRKTALTLLASGVCIATNWSIYIVGVLTGRLLSVSMGYFINPLVSVLLGVLILKERLRFWQIIAVLCAFIGVLYMTVGSGGVPWISISLAFSFGLYGLLRKTVAVESVPGTFVETLLVSPIVISFLLFEGIRGRSAFGTADALTHLFLIGAGVVTALPIIWFANGARRIPLSLVGFLQYLAPTCQLLMGVFLYRENFTLTHFISFTLIWIGIIIFTLSTLLQRKPETRAPRTEYRARQRQYHRPGSNN